MEKTIIYDNRSFCLGSAKRYYFATIKGKRTSLHRYKYEKEIGPIPEGWHIHHKDRNCFNNSTDNLEPIDPHAHSKLHPPTKEVISKWQQAGSRKAPIWHASPEGKEWHFQNYLKNKHLLHKRFTRKCSHCGKVHETVKKAANCFCSNACKSAWRRKNKPDMVSKSCPACGSSFQTRKYLPKTYCSLKCKPAPNPLGYHSRFLKQ